MKICSKCKKELEDFQFHKNKNNKDGLQFYCKNCRALKQRKIEKQIRVELRNRNKKICLNCKQELDIFKFSKNKNKEDGLEIYCKSCKKIYHKKYYQINKSKQIRNSRNYYENNKEKKLRQNKNYYEKNIKKVKKYAKKWNEKNKKYKLEQNRIYRQNHKKERNESLKIRRQTDINFKIINNIRTRINRAIKNNQKKGYTIELLGCSIDFYKEFLLQKFTFEMSWENYGSVWEIDHIIPCASFDLTKEKNQFKCFNYINTQPLLCSENRSKSDKLDWSRN